MHPGLILAYIVYYLFSSCYKLLYYWFTVILPIFIAFTFGIYFIITCIGKGLDTGIIILFTIISIVIALYIINGKEMFFNIVKKFKNIIFFPLDKKKNDSLDNNKN
jgi:uncharacterized membrane-anchored protein